MKWCENRPKLDHIGNEDIFYNKTETTIVQKPYNKLFNQEIENNNKNNSENDGSYHCANVTGESGKEKTKSGDGNKSDRGR